MEDNLTSLPTNDESLLPTDVPTDRPLSIGVFGGSFNPIHLGHVLLAITTQQTKPVDQVVLVPVYKHAVKRDLLPFDDRVRMCRAAVGSFGQHNRAIVVSTVERRVGASNGAMLRALQQEYPEGTRFWWICGDDFFRWMERPKGLETLAHVSGLIVQRRLHKRANGQLFQEDLDEARVRAKTLQLDIHLDFIYGELPHFSSTLVRQAPGSWRSFLPQAVAAYLDARPHLQEQLLANLQADATAEAAQTVLSGEQPVTAASNTACSTTTTSAAAFKQAGLWVMRGLDMVHMLQYERGMTGLRLSTGTTQKYQQETLEEVQRNTDRVLREILDAHAESDQLVLLPADDDWPEVQALAAELQQVPTWLTRDRATLARRQPVLTATPGVEGWAARYSLVEKFHARLDLLTQSTVRALVEIRANLAVAQAQPTPSRSVPELLRSWCQGKEALGRLRAFVCAGGPDASTLVRESLATRQQLVRVMEAKDRCIARVLILEAGVSTRLAAPDALHRMLSEVTKAEWSLMGCCSYVANQPGSIQLVHQQLASGSAPSDEPFSVQHFFEASSTAIDFLLTFAKALAASACSTL